MGYQLSTVCTNDTVLTVYFAAETINQTSFQCEFPTQLVSSSSVGILTVMGKAKYFNP